MTTTALALVGASLLPPVAFANSNAASTVYISTTAANDDLSEAAFALLTYVEITGVGSHGETGTNTNILTYDTWDTSVAQKAKGISDAGSPEIEVSRSVTDAGQIALRAAALTSDNYAFKIVRTDKLNATGTPTILYNRGLITGPRRPMGRNEDFDLEIFTLALQQLEVVTDATAGI